MMFTLALFSYICKSGYMRQYSAILIYPLHSQGSATSIQGRNIRYMRIYFRYLAAFAKVAILLFAPCGYMLSSPHIRPYSLYLALFGHAKLYLLQFAICGIFRCTRVYAQLYPLAYSQVYLLYSPYQCTFAVFTILDSILLYQPICSIRVVAIFMIFTMFRNIVVFSNVFRFVSFAMCGENRYICYCVCNMCSLRQYLVHICCSR